MDLAKPLKLPQLEIGLTNVVKFHIIQEWFKKSAQNYVHSGFQGRGGLIPSQHTHPYLFGTMSNFSRALELEEP